MWAEPELSTGPRDHIVRFYTREDELIEPTGGYLLEALRAGGVAIVLATSVHRDALARRLIAAGLDLAAARDTGRYFEFDAQEKIDQFVLGDLADPARFYYELSPVIRNAAAGGRPVRIFGEMVALLWESGRVNAAIEVEAMWNELGAQYPFSLACAYRAPQGGDDSVLDALSQVCRAHVAVSGDPLAASRAARS